MCVLCTHCYISGCKAVVDLAVESIKAMLNYHFCASETRTCPQAHTRMHARTHTHAHTHTLNFEPRKGATPRDDPPLPKAD